MKSRVVIGGYVRGVAVKASSAVSAVMSTTNTAEM